MVKAHYDEPVVETVVVSPGKVVLELDLKEAKLLKGVLGKFLVGSPTSDIYSEVDEAIRESGDNPLSDNGYVIEELNRATGDWNRVKDTLRVRVV